MRTQTQSKAQASQIIDHDREDADRALAFYCEIRKVTGLKPLEVIIGMWSTKNWSDSSKEMFLADIRRKQPCDAGVKKLNYAFQSINQYVKMRRRYMRQRGQNDI